MRKFVLPLLYGAMALLLWAAFGLPVMLLVGGAFAALILRLALGVTLRESASNPSSRQVPAARRFVANLGRASTELLWFLP